MADKGISDIEVVHRFLKDVMPKFHHAYGDMGERCNASTSKEFKNVLQDAMEYFSDGNVRAAQSRQIQEELAKTKDAMFNNIDQALLRGEKIDVLVDRTDELSQQSGQFKRKATSVKRRYACQYAKMWVMCVIFVVVILYIAISEIAGGCFNPGDWGHCGKGKDGG